MSEKEKKKRRPLSQEEYSVLVSSVCFSVIVLLAFGIGAYKLVRAALRWM